MSVLKPVYNIYQLKMYPILIILTFGCRFPRRADNAAYPHDGRADKRRYRHDRRADSQCQVFSVYFPCGIKKVCISVNQKFVFLYGRNQISTLNNFRV